jgi:hypothetical protein
MEKETLLTKIQGITIWRPCLGLTKRYSRQQSHKVEQAYRWDNGRPCLARERHPSKVDQTYLVCWTVVTRKRLFCMVPPFYSPRGVITTKGREKAAKFWDGPTWGNASGALYVLHQLDAERLQAMYRHKDHLVWATHKKSRPARPTL